MLSTTAKISLTLLFLAILSPYTAARVGDIEEPLRIKSHFVLRAGVGPPKEKSGVNRYAPSYLLDFKAQNYRRDVFFSSDGRYIIFQDYYGFYQLSQTQSYNLANFINIRKKDAFVESWKYDLKTQLGKAAKDGDKGAVQIDIPWEPPRLISGIIGEGRSNIKVTGTRSITFSGKSQWEDGLVNTGTFKQSKFPVLQMEQKSRFKVTGTIGSKITVEVDQDSQRNTELANTIKLRYKGDEDEILQSIEAGNTNLALPNAQFIGYSENVQGLFGIKASAKVGNFDLTMITSQEKGSSEKASFNAGARGDSTTIKDYEYLANAYFSLRSDYNPLDSLISVELYTKGFQGQDPNGIMCVQPNDSLPYISPDEETRVEYEVGPFAVIPSAQYDVFRQAWVVSLHTPLSTPNAILGAYIKFARYDLDGQADTIVVGNLNYRPDTTLVLKLLKHSSPTPSFATWDLMWRNVYDLRARNLSSDGFELRIFKGGGGELDPEDQRGKPFVTILGLDSVNNSNNNPVPDSICDFNNRIIDAAKGHLFFPERKPFLNPELDETVEEIYSKTPGHSDARNATKYYIMVKSSERSSSFPLGRANIIEGSEVVKFGDGRILQRNVDYTINYDIGQITFLTDEALNPAANISIDFEYAPFFQPEKKTLFGVAGQYHLFENSDISVAAMYRSETMSEPRPRVGREPRKGLVWDANFALNFQPDLMTDLVDILPLVEADANSALNISGEIAQSFPNPNTKDKAYIDDFEGTKISTNLSCRRGIWTRCSPPLDNANQKLDLANKAPLWWYNPIEPITIKTIWPDREVKSQDNRQDVLYLEFFPDTTTALPESTWAGIFRPMFSGLADHSLSKFIEFWYFPDTTVDAGAAPTLHFNFGMISEDLNDNGELETEDRLNGRQDGIFQADEDTGLDGKFDSEEPGYGPDNPDPNGDNWHYSEDNSHDYSRINGTEGNRLDPDRRDRFDTEDINNNSSLDRQNGYFDYTVDLNNPEYLVDSTTSNWKLLRIPLQDIEAYGTPRGAAEAADFSRLNFARLWMTGAREHYLLKIASFELVGNKWQELDIGYPEGDTVRSGEKFEVTVKNNQENTDYNSPPGVEGELDRETQIREKEQSLVLSSQNLYPGHVAGAAWNLYQAENYTLYENMKMFVHGDSLTSDGHVIFFFRLSQDGSNYYEYRTTLEPGWSENNEVLIDFEKITELKYELHKNTVPESLSVADTTDGKYSIYGNPSLSQVKWFIVGIEIDESAPNPYTGEVWIDELVVTDVRRQSDFASRLQATAKFSDFAEANITYSKMGADFFPLSVKTPSGATQTSKSARLSARLNRFFPPSLGMNLPVTYTWQNTLSLPRLKTGSDIILQETARRFERTENSSFSYTVNQSFNKNTKNPIWNLTLNRFNSGYTYSKSTGTSPTSPESWVITYKGDATYDLTPRAKPGFKPFFFSKYIFLPKSIYDAQLFYLPTKLNLKAEINGVERYSVNQRGIVTSSRTKDMNLVGGTSLGLFSTLKASYNITSARDISEEGRFKLSVNPSKLKFGRERSFQQRFDSSFQPKILKLFDNKFSFNSSYGENSDFQRNPDSTRSIQLQGALRADVTFNITSLISKKGGAKAPPPRAGGRQNQTQGNNDDDEESEDKPKFTAPKKLVGGIWGAIRSIKPIRGYYVKDKRLDRQGLIERPSWQYMFGFADNPRAAEKASQGRTSPGQSNYSDTYSFDSGIQPVANLDIGLNYNNKKTISRRPSSDPTKSTSITFPDITVTLSGVEKAPLFKKFSKTASFQFGYSKKVDEDGRADINQIYTRDTSRRFAPLMGLTLNLINNVRGGIRYESTKGKNQNLRGEGQANITRNNSENSLTINMSYSLSAPQGLKLPFLKRVKFNSQLTISMDISIRNSKSESVTGEIKTPDASRSELKVEPKVQYQFSRAITGGLRASWSDGNDKILERKTHIRELGIWTEIRF